MSDQLPADPETVPYWLLQLAPCKSMGPDGIHLTILIELGAESAMPLSIVFQWSWDSREVPTDWKLANTVPIFKKGRKEGPGNYRPVSVSSVPDKFTENIILGTTEKDLKGNTVPGNSTAS